MRDGSFLGVDIGKTGHYALAVDVTGAVVVQRQVANDETDLRKLVVWASEHQAAVIIDQSGGTAALLLQLCWQSEVPIAYLHGSAMARARGFYAGESKTDPKDAFVLADVARAHPDRLVWWLEPTSAARALPAVSQDGLASARRGERHACRDDLPPHLAHSRLASSSAELVPGGFRLIFEEAGQLGASSSGKSPARPVDC
jgi:hypothetical protein